jgi:hypothetical protein
MTEHSLLSADTLIFHRVASIDEADLPRGGRRLPVPLVPPQHQPVVAQWYPNNGHLEMRWLRTSQEG